MKTNAFTVAATTVAVLCLGACEIQTDEEGEMPSVDVSGDAGKLPDYDVVKREEGRLPSVDVDVEGGELPDYDVEMAEVSVGTEEVTASVPDVDVEMEEETFSVPDVDVVMPSEKEKQ